VEPTELYGTEQERAKELATASTLAAANACDGSHIVEPHRHVEHGASNHTESLPRFPKPPSLVLTTPSFQRTDCDQEERKAFTPNAPWLVDASALSHRHRPGYRGFLSGQIVVSLDQEQ
jgi:hypothetical protein